MKSSYLISALAGAALVVSAPLVAQSRGGGHNNGAHSGGMNQAKSGNTATNRGSMNRQNGTTTRAGARQRSQGPANASTRARERANQNSVLSGSGTAADRTDTMQTDRGTTTRSNARRNSQGRANAADRAVERANENSALSSTAMAAGVPPCTRERTDQCIQTNERGMRMKSTRRNRR